MLPGRPGSVRELDQCVRNVLVRKQYHPPAGPRTRPSDGLRDALRDGGVTAKELVRRYCTLVYARTGSYQETARRLDLDRRTVKRSVDPALLETLTADNEQRSCPAPRTRQLLLA